MADVTLRIASEQAYGLWLDGLRQTSWVHSIASSQAHYIDVEDVSYGTSSLQCREMTFDEQTPLRVAVGAIISESGGIIPPPGDVSQEKQMRREWVIVDAAFGLASLTLLVAGIISHNAQTRSNFVQGFIFFLVLFALLSLGCLAYKRAYPNIGYEFHFPTLNSRSNGGGSRKPLRKYGFMDGDIVVVVQTKSVPGASGRWQLYNDKRFWSEDFDNFLDQAITHGRYRNPGILGRLYDPQPRGLGGVVLYTDEDWALAKYLRQHFGDLHVMSGLLIMLYMFEDKPRRSGDRVRDVRAFWAERLRPRVYQRWSELGLTTTKPRASEAVFHFCNRIGVAPDNVPCIVLFREWKNIRVEREIIPIEGPYDAFFRSFCSDIKRAMEEIAAQRNIPELLAGDSGDSFMTVFSNRWRSRLSASTGVLSPARRRYNSPSPTLFLCYSPADRSFAERLARDLRSLGLSIWFDKWEIGIGNSIIDKIEEGLQSQDCLAIVLSPESVASPWVQRELNVALLRELNEDRVVILPILYQHCDIPPLIGGNRFADFTKSYSTGMDMLLGQLNVDL